MGKHSITLSQEQRRKANQMIKAGTAPARSITHAHILVKADDRSQGLKWSDRQIEQSFGVSYRTIFRTRQRFVEQGMQAALFPQEARGTA